MEHMNEVIDMLSGTDSPSARSKNKLRRKSSESPHLIARNAAPFEKESYPTASVYKRSQVAEVNLSKKR